jgi:XTP/dITP diphosphohydrolase/tetrapyrrole methylase family protein/MazG family protein
VTQWEQIKAQEKKAGPPVEPNRVFKAMPPRLPALMWAEAVWKQIEKKQLSVGPAVDGAVIASLGAELDEAELGRRLFALAAAARAKDLDPEGALRRYTNQVMREVETEARASLEDTGTER